MDNAYQTSWQSVCDEFEVDPQVGLKPEQVEDSRKKHGVNGEELIALLCLLRVECAQLIRWNGKWL